VTEGANAGTEALLALNPIQRAQQKSKEPEHKKENVTLKGLQTVHREQYLRLEISASFLWGGRGVGEILFRFRMGERNPVIEVILDDYVRQVGSDFQVVDLAKKFLRNLSAVLSDLYDYLFVQPDIHGC
jgi:hypothetical protein